MVAGRLRVASGIDQRLIPKPQPVPAVGRTPGFQQPADQGYHVLDDLLAVARDIVGPVIHPAKSAVAQWGVAVEPQLARHAVPQLDQLIV